MKNSNDDLGERIKMFYENRAKTQLIRRIPVIIRIDGRSFSSFCKRFEKPYDTFLNNSLNQVMKFLCENIQGAKFAERHSDEISILVTDYGTITTDAFFDYEVQKICSICASLATSEFCKQLILENTRREEDTKQAYNLGQSVISQQTMLEIIDENSPVLSMEEKFPTFDARCFNIPESEISNYLYWRWLDSRRGSVNMWAQANFSHKELQGKHCDEMKEMLLTKGIDWDGMEQHIKTGFMCVKRAIDKPIVSGPLCGQVVKRNVWEIIDSAKDNAEIVSLVTEGMSQLK